MIAFSLLKCKKIPERSSFLKQFYEYQTKEQLRLRHSSLLEFDVVFITKKFIIT